MTSAAVSSLISLCGIRGGPGRLAERAQSVRPGRHRGKLLGPGLNPGDVREAPLLADLRDRGVITAEEFEREKAKILA
jgi:Short C-terminal domain